MERSRLTCLLVALFAAALCLRLRGIDWLLPHLVEPDAHVAAQLEVFRSGKAEWRSTRDYDTYPYLLARMLALRPEPGAPASDGTAGDHLRRAMGSVLETRYLVAILGAAMAPLTLVLARRFLPPPAALLAACWIAFSLLHQHYAQQARPHVASASFTLLAVLACLRLRDRPSTANHLLAGGAAALAVGVLHNGVAVLIPLCVALLLARRPARGRSTELALLALVVPVGAMLVWSYPFFFTDGGAGLWRLFAPDPGGPRQASHTSFRWSYFDGSGFPKALEGLWSFEPLTLLFAALGAIAWCARLRGAQRDHRDLLVVLAYAVPYLIATGMFAWVQVRFLLPLTPFLACAAAHGAYALVGQRSAILAALAPLLLAFPAWTTWRLTALRAAPDTLERAAAWIVEHSVPGQDVMAGIGVVLPLATAPDEVHRDAAATPGIRPYPWVEYLEQQLATHGPRAPIFDGARAIRFAPLQGKRDLLAMMRDPGAWLRQQSADFLVVQLQDKRGDAVTKQLHAAAAEHAQLAVRFSAEARADRWIYPFAYLEEPPEDPFHFGLRTLRCGMIGPTIEIYRLGAAGRD